MEPEDHPISLSLLSSSIPEWNPCMCRSSRRLQTFSRNPIRAVTRLGFHDQTSRWAAALIGLSWSSRTRYGSASLCQTSGPIDSSSASNVWRNVCAAVSNGRTMTDSGGNLQECDACISLVELNASSNAGVSLCAMGRGRALGSERLSGQGYFRFHRKITELGLDVISRTW